jgi:glucan 1,3-beta-glucosidase
MVQKLKGVNLGGWLVLERWLAPSVFGRYRADDEYTLCAKLGDKKRRAFKRHRDNFITEQDFKWISDQGLNAVRLPVGHWTFGGYQPFVSSSSYVTKALDWSAKYGLKMILDLHTAPGSQNGWPSSGRVGDPGWHKDPDQIDQTINVIGQIAQRYGSHPGLWGVELMNEPHREVLISTLQDYYRRAYQKFREYVSPDKAVIISDAYRPIAEWGDFINSPEFNNIFLDIHLYQTFSERDKRLAFEERIVKAMHWKNLIDTFGPEKILVGEWSIVSEGAYGDMDEHTAAEARKLYFQAQQYAFSGCAGRFYWTYKTEAADDWNFREFVKKLTVR